jgi:putative ABC transport system permease protein
LKSALVNAGYRAEVGSFTADVVRNVRAALQMLWGGVACLLLIAAVNITNLSLARATGRLKEVATRTALGAARVRVVRQLVTETTLLTLVGGGLGLALGYWGLGALATLGLADMPRAHEIRMDGVVIVFILVVALVLGVIVGAVPAMHIAGTNLNVVLREDGRTGTAGRGARTIRGALVVAQVALAFVLLLGAGLLMASFQQLLNVDPGFRPEHVLTGRVSPLKTRYSDEDSLRSYTSRALERIRALPGVEAAGATSFLPFSWDSNSSVIIPEGYVMSPGESVVSPNQLYVTPGYLEALRVPIREGRAIAASDSVDAPLAAVVNATMARRYWAGTSPLGARIRLGDEPSPDAWRTVVGVAGDIRNDDIDAPTLPQVFVPLAQRPERDMTVVVRTADNPIAHVGDARAAVAAVDRNQPLFAVRSMDQLLEEDVRGTVVLVGLASIFGVVSLALAATGIYGVLAYSVAQSTREIGIRMALGSTASAVLARVIRQGLGPVLIGLSMGLAAAAGLSRALAGILFGVSSSDPATYAAAAGVMIGTALLACVIPAGRAARTDPLAALRCE